MRTDGQTDKHGQAIGAMLLLLVDTTPKTVCKAFITPGRNNKCIQNFSWKTS
jgi:hypothetical protein